MAKTATLSYEGKLIELPLVDGTQDELGIDIKTLRAKTNLITLDPGFKNTGSCQSAITFLDGEQGILRYRGYDINELANSADFLEVAYLLIFGELPNEELLEKFLVDIKEESYIDEDLKKILESFPSAAHPMGVLSSLTSALTAFNSNTVDVDNEVDMYRAITRIMGKLPVLVAWVFRKKAGLPLKYGDYALGYVENIARMMFRKPNKEYVANPVVDAALNKLLILHAEHEQNCSTSTVRIVGS